MLYMFELNILNRNVIQVFDTISVLTNKKWYWPINLDILRRSDDDTLPFLASFIILHRSRCNLLLARFYLANNQNT